MTICYAQFIHSPNIYWVFLCAKHWSRLWRSSNRQADKIHSLQECAFWRGWQMRNNYIIISVINGQIASRVTKNSVVGNWESGERLSWSGRASGKVTDSWADARCSEADDLSIYCVPQNHQRQVLRALFSEGKIEVPWGEGMFLKTTQFKSRRGWDLSHDSRLPDTRAVSVFKLGPPSLVWFS